MNQNDLVTLIRAIVSGQKQIIGPMAVDQANHVEGLKITHSLETIETTGEADTILRSLIKEYEKLFGTASIEACKESVKKVLPSIQSNKIPEFLR